ncbi:MAG: AMP-binding protein [Acidobacteria bacterium]|nr:AMP-binding protein [Acidobacteriota bacterium]
MTAAPAIRSDGPTLAAVLRHRAGSSAGSIAFVEGTCRLTYGELRDDAQRLGAAFAAAGVVAGDRVALALPSGLDFVRAFFALQRIGAIPCAFDPSIPAPTLVRRAGRIRPRLLVTGGHHGDPLAQAAQEAGLDAVGIDDLGVGGGHVPPVPDDTEAVAFLQPTSGTSGEPRAAVVRQRNVIASLRASRELLDPGPSDVLVGWVPPWHDLGLLRFVLGPVYLGVPCHVVPPAIRTIPQWLSTIAEVRGTITGAPDFAYRLATRLVDPCGLDLSSLRFATNGGEPVRASTVAAFEARFSLHDVLRAGYGLAEATLGVSCVRPGEAMRVDARGNVSCGRPLDGVEVRLDAPAGAGEILVKSPAVFAGYFEDEEATRGVLDGGWLRTGDVGALDDNGQLFVLGRKRAMLKRGGIPLAPRELEEIAQTVPGVRIAAAVGLPAGAGGLTEEIVVVVEAEAGVPGRERLAAMVSSAVEHALGFAPERVVTLEPRSIPLTANGKIRHDVLRGQLAGRS